MIITIDGPTASGKSTVAQTLANTYHLYHINSGLLYRALAYLITEYEGYTQDALLLVSSHDIAAYGDPQRLKYVYTAHKGGEVFFDGVNITALLKNAHIDACASVLSVRSAVRAQVDAIQHHIASEHDVIVDGRDAGSVVFPHADIKFFLTASLIVRARRWQHMQEHKGFVFTSEQAEQEVARRDERDSQRSVAPLVVPHNAIVVDSTQMTLQETVNVMANYMNLK